MALTALFGATTSAVAADGRIVGGEKVSQGTYDSQYSAVVSVQYDARFGNRRSPAINTHVCGGTVIAPRLVLTAAHCVNSDTPTLDGTGFSVLRRASLAGRDSAAGAVEVDAVFVHPEFAGYGSPYGWYGYGGGQSNPGYDVAVLRLAAPIEGVTPIPLVQPAEDAAAWGDGLGRATGATTLGWGMTVAPGFGGRRSTDLHTVGLAIRADRRCERSDFGLRGDAASFDADTMLCAGTADGPGAGNSAKAACFGDSGGPLLAPAADGSQRVVGVASWTPSSAPCTSWSVYARIAELRDWIASVPSDGAGVAGLVGPSTLSATVVDANSIRVSWPMPASGTPERYRIYRSVASASRFPFWGPSLPPGSLGLAAITDADDRSIVIHGIAPRRPGVTRRHTIRIDAQDDLGNRAAGANVAVDAPVDARRPSATGAPNIRPTRRGTYIGFRPARDNDCIGRYVVQVRGEGGWRDSATWFNRACDSVSLIPNFQQFFGWWGTRGEVTAHRLPLQGIAAGTWRVRIVAVDRAGNRTTSPSRVFELATDLRRTTHGTCIGSGGTLLCSNGSARRGVGIIIR